MGSAFIFGGECKTIGGFFFEPSDSAEPENFLAGEGGKKELLNSCFGLLRLCFTGGFGANSFSTTRFSTCVFGCTGNANSDELLTGSLYGSKPRIRSKSAERWVGLAYDSNEVGFLKGVVSTTSCFGFGVGENSVD